LTVQDGRNYTAAAGFQNAGLVTVGAGSTFTVSGAYTQSGGETLLLGGRLVATATVQINGGVLAGTGTLQADVVNGGEVDPGGTGAAGLLTITGNYRQTASGVLNLELGGTAASAFDQLRIMGTATLDGTLNVSLLDGYGPSLGDSFQLLSFASRGSTVFGTINVPDLGGLRFDPSYEAGDLSLVVDVS
jgi:hypothetical protein